MSTAPPGWHRQPDGRERFWDGQQWTDEFRDPSTAPTQAIPTGQTQSMWAGAGEPPAGTEPYAQGGGAYRPAYEQPGPRPREPYYGTGAPPSGGTPGWLKGCLVGLVVLLIVAAIGLFVGWRMLTDAIEGGTWSPTSESTSDEPTADETTDTDIPVIPGLPTDLPTDFPTDVPSLPGAGETVEASIGEGFTLGPAQVQPGWGVADLGLGLTNVVMTIVPTESGSVPLVFRLDFLKDGAQVAQTFCTASLETAGEETEVACVPTTNEAKDADRVTAVGGLG